MNKNPIRCEICGRFIAYKEIGTKAVTVEYIPDTQMTEELTLFKHKRCVESKLLELKSFY